MKEDSGSMVMAGQEDGEDAGVGKVSTGAGVDSGPDPVPEPAWTFDGNGLMRSDSGD